MVPNRQIDIENDINFLKEKGYHIMSSFVDFFKEYGHIDFLTIVNGNKRYIDFDVQKNIRYDYHSVIIEDYPKITNSKTLIPIGNIDESLYLVIDENNIIYSLYDGSVMIVGKSINEALDNLCNSDWRRLEELPISHWW